MGTPSRIFKRILVLDDEPMVAKTIRMVLTLQGYEVEVAHSGKEALSLLEQIAFDLIITDYNMPEMLGDELALHIKARRPELPVIMLTAFAENIRNSPNIAVCVDAVIGKPFNMVELRLTVARLIASRSFPESPS
jgi:two-component system chemotaxis response regulator CheY